MAEDINLVQVGVETLADVAQDRNVDAQVRVSAAMQLITIAMNAQAKAAEVAPNRASRRKS